MKRGEIYYIDNARQHGDWDRAARPAIIVSSDQFLTDDTVEVVYLTTHPKKDLPTHVVIEATGIKSTALCERVAFVDKYKVGDLCGVCSAAEMQAVDEAILLSLGIVPAPVVTYHHDEAIYQRVLHERDAYKALLKEMLGHD